MCTAVTWKTKDTYFGRTLDHDCAYGEEVVLAPRQFPLPFRHRDTLGSHYAILGMAHVFREYPLYYEAVNEQGLAMAGLNFVGYAHYRDPRPGKENIAQFELIPWILGRCASVAQARALLERTNITAEPVCADLPAARLHWLLADREEAVTVEAGKDGMKIWDNPVGVLTNNPAFDDQLFRLNDYMHLSPREPENRFSPKIALTPYSRGMGALGLPGDLSSQSRFVRAAFVKLNSISGPGEEESVGQFFHILDTVLQPRGCCDLGGGKQEVTLYASCCNTDRGIYYYTTYGNRQITAVHMHREDLDGAGLVRYPLVRGEQIREQN